MKSVQDDDIPLIDSPQTDASRLLEAALQQMDGIISGQLKLLLLKLSLFNVVVF